MRRTWTKQQRAAAAEQLRRVCADPSVAAKRDANRRAAAAAAMAREDVKKKLSRALVRRLESDPAQREKWNACNARRASEARRIPFGGVLVSITDLAALAGMNWTTMHKRLSRMTAEEAVMTALRRHKRTGTP